MTPKGRLPVASRADRPQTFPAEGVRKGRVSILNGCVQTVLDPAINEATIRLLQRHGIEVVVRRGGLLRRAFLNTWARRRAPCACKGEHRRMVERSRRP